jgi:hypothetical protein
MLSLHFIYLSSVVVQVTYESLSFRLMCGNIENIAYSSQFSKNSRENDANGMRPKPVVNSANQL